MAWNLKWCKKLDVQPTELVKTSDELLLKIKEVLSNASDLQTSEERPQGRQVPPVIASLIKSELKKGQVIPFLGAGATSSARDDNRSWSKNESFPPTTRELAHWLAEQAYFPGWFLSDTQNLSRVASYYVLSQKAEREKAEEVLQNALAGVFQNDGETGKVQNYLADNAETLPLIITTNYDGLIEKAFHGKPFRKLLHVPNSKYLSLVEYNAQGEVSNKEPKLEPQKLQGIIGLGNSTLLYKMHGSADERTFVITEEDYVKFISQGSSKSSMIPNPIFRWCQGKSFLFLGYGLEDWNFRVILQRLQLGAFGQSPHWAIQQSPTEADEKVWGLRKVEIFDMDLNKFIRLLE